MSLIIDYQQSPSAKRKMRKSKCLAAMLFNLCSIASAQDVLLAGHVQRVVLQPSGTEHCPPPCPPALPAVAGKPQAVCISNVGGCQMMELKVDHVYRGVVHSQTRQFSSRIGEFGPSFPVTEKQIVVNEEGGKVSWSFADNRNGKIFIDPKRLRSVAGITSATQGDGEWVALDEVLARKHGHED